MAGRRKTGSNKSAGKGTLLPDFLVNTFGGLDTATKNTDDLDPGVSPDSLNWITGAAQDPKTGKYFGDHIELRRGYALLGQTRDNVSKYVSGLGVGITQDGIQIPIFSAGQHVKYYNAASNVQDVVEIGTNLLPSAAATDDVSIVPYSNLANYSVYISSQNSSIYKIILADIENPIDFQQPNFRGTLAVGQNRLFLWGRRGQISGTDFVNLYLSYIDATTISSTPPFNLKSQTQLNAVTGSTNTYNGTLTIDGATASTVAYQNVLLTTFAAAIGPQLNIVTPSGDSSNVQTSTPHGFVVGDVVVFNGGTEGGGLAGYNGVIALVTAVIDTENFTVSTTLGDFTGYQPTVALAEQFIDDLNGNLFSNLGGTGTINYVTGAYTLDFNTTPLASGDYIWGSYYEEADLNNGVIDFIVPGSRSTGEADYFAQPGMGNLMNVLGLSNIYFCFHQFGCMQLQIPQDDTQSTNLLYRSNVGIPYWRAAYPTGDGIPYLDTLNEAEPKLRILETETGVSVLDPAIVPESLSDALDLSLNSFNYAVVYQWGDYYILECQGMTNGVPDATNDVFYLYNSKTGFFDKLDYRARCFYNYYGALIAGDSGSGNVFVLFSGNDDDGYNIQNYWRSAPSFLGAPGTKRVDKLVIKGLIQPSQNLNVSLSYDNGEFVQLPITIAGNGPYVATGSPVEVGGQTAGTNVVGGGGTITAFPFEVELIVGSDFFNRVAIQFEADSVGYVEVDSYEFKNIRYKSRHILASNMQVG